MPQLDTVIRSRRVVTPDGTAPAAVGLRGGRIAAVAPPGARLPAREEVDLGEAALLPGLVDPDVVVQAPGRPLRECYLRTAADAVRGGVTAVAVAPSPVGPPLTGEAGLQEHQSAAAGVLLHVALLGAVTDRSTPADLAELRSAGAAGFHCSLSDGGAPGGGPIGDAPLRKAMMEVAAMEAPLLVHAEDAGELDPAPPGGPAPAPAARPARAERRGLERVIAAARVAGTRTHVSPFTAAECAAVLGAARAIGVALSAHTCPHYLCLPVEAVPEGSPAFRCRPPLRSGANRDALWSALLSDADCPIRTIGSGHRPGTGVAAIGWTLPALWTAARRRGLDLAAVARWTSANPAELLGLADKGRIAPGAEADLVAFAPEAAQTVPGDDPGPYAGHTLTGRVERTWVGGRSVFPAPAAAPRARAAEHGGPLPASP
ncbi:amidohydrolase family protein [Nocardiopsis suaedae]|uniref:Amidohydrolase family protein n=1 Tax=Nocardiopsis suaedae TaxID=3018444 RepID=A0ABT4TU26_9ACTN|nr:amidohydrolase family protein [Nocardiopsis suaedae]MDA2807921.1 amidohydrolase family protein [Nocardiopsis suaedae]